MLAHIIVPYISVPTNELVVIETTFPFIFILIINALQMCCGKRREKSNIRFHINKAIIVNSSDKRREKEFLSWNQRKSSDRREKSQVDNIKCSLIQDKSWTSWW